MMATEENKPQRVKIRHRIAAQGIRILGWTRITAVLRTLLAHYRQKRDTNIAGEGLAAYLADNGFTQTVIRRHAPVIFDAANFAKMWPQEVAETEHGFSFAFVRPGRKVLIYLSKLHGQAMIGRYVNQWGSWAVDGAADKAKPREISAAFEWLEG